jgi:hypothetical protein
VLTVLAASACLLVGGAAGAPESSAATAPAGLRGSLWAVGLNTSNYRLLTAARAASLRSHRINTLVLAGQALPASRVSQLVSRAQRAGISVYLPLEQQLPSSPATIQSAESSCRSLKLASPGSRCALQAASVSAALELARSRLVDLVIVPVSRPGALTKLGGRHERILALAPLGRFSRRPWARAIRIARRGGSVDLGVVPEGRRAARALRRYGALLSSLVSAKRGHRAPHAPRSLASTGSTTTSVTVSWKASRLHKPHGYDVYLEGRLSSRTRKTHATLSDLTCGHAYLVEVDGRDAAGDRSRKRFVQATTAACGGGGSLTEANVWVDGNGGSCTRSPTPVHYDDSAACDSLDQAYGAAALGDTVGVKGGDYPEQTIVQRSDKSATGDLPDVVFAPAAGETVRLAGLQFGTGGVGGTGTNGPDHITIENMSAYGSNCAWLIEGGSNDITWRNLDACNFGIDASHDITVDGGDWGPCNAGDGGCGNNHLYGNDSTNITIENAVIHDFTKTNDSQHFECLIDFGTGGTTGLVIRNNWFHNCVVYDIFLQQLGETIRPITIENNFFDHSTGNGYPVGDYGNGEWRSIAFSPRNTPFSDVLVRFNSFQADGGISLNDDSDGTTYSNFRVVGNLIGHANCGIAGVTYLYNVYADNSTCGGTGELGLHGSFPYVNPAYGGQGNYHLTGPATAIDGLVPAAVGCPANDHDWQPRPQPPGSNCDAGADER